MNKEVLRNYHLTDVNLMSHSKNVEAYLIEELGQFTAFDTTINKAYCNELKELIAVAEEGVSDNVIIDQQVQLSDEADNKFDEAKQLIRHVFYFVKKAFTSKAIQNEFGLNDFGNIKSSKSKMILFLRDMSKVAVKYQEQLNKQGCKKELIAQISILHDELNDITQKRELFKGNRPVITQERIEKYNAIWDKVKLVIEAAKIIHSDNMPKLKRYLVSRNNTKTKDTKVAPGAKVIGLNNDIDENTVIEIKNTGHATLQFYIADSKESTIPENALTLAAKENITITAHDISNSTYGLVIAYNPGEKESSFVVNVLEEKKNLIQSRAGMI